MRIRLALGCVAVLAAGSLSACSPVPKGTAALLLGEDGELVALVKTCDTEVDGIRLYRTPLDYDVEWVEVGAADADIGEESAGQVGTGVAMDDLEDTQRYQLTAQTTDSSEVIERVGFDVDDLANLEPGQVLVGDYDRSPGLGATESATPFGQVTPSTPASAPPERPRVLTEEEFGSQSCIG